MVLITQTTLGAATNSAAGIPPLYLAHLQAARHSKCANYLAAPLSVDDVRTAFAQSFLASGGLSNESVKYYASLVKFYTVYKLQRTAPMTTRLYLLCFAYHRFRQINDNLVDAFIHLVDQYEQVAKSAALVAAQKALSEASANLDAAGQEPLVGREIVGHVRKGARRPTWASISGGTYASQMRDSRPA